MTNLNVTPTTISNPSSANKLEEKLSDWIHKIEASTPDYCAITAMQGKMYYIAEKNASELLSVNMLIDQGNGLEKIFVYRNEDHQANAEIPPFTVIIKKEEKLIANLNDKIFGFGFKDSITSEVKHLLLHFQTASTHTFVAAGNNASSIEVFYAWNPNPNDPIKFCMEALFDSVSK